MHSMSRAMWKAIRIRRWQSCRGTASPTATHARPRTLIDPTNVSCSGGPGNMMVFDESIDRYSSGNVSLNIIDPSKLPRGRNEFGHCVPVYPHDAIRTNTIFEVVRAKGGRTAWADKHPAYDLVNGPSGKGVEDLYTPEITNVGGF